MPKAFLTEEERICSRFSRFIYGELKVRKITQTTMAKKRGITHQALSHKLCNGRFTLADFAFFVKELGMSDKEIRDILED